MWNNSEIQSVPHYAWKLHVPGIAVATLLPAAMYIPDTEPLQAQSLIMPKFWRAWQHVRNVSST